MRLPAVSAPRQRRRQINQTTGYLYLIHTLRSMLSKNIRTRKKYRGKFSPKINGKRERPSNETYRRRRWPIKCNIDRKHTHSSAYRWRERDEKRTDENRWIFIYFLFRMKYNLLIHTIFSFVLAGSIGSTDIFFFFSISVFTYIRTGPLACSLALALSVSLSRAHIHTLTHTHPHELTVTYTQSSHHL